MSKTKENGLLANGNNRGCRLDTNPKFVKPYWLFTGDARLAPHYTVQMYSNSTNSRSNVHRVHTSILFSLAQAHFANQIMSMQN